MAEPIPDPYTFGFLISNIIFTLTVFDANLLLIMTDKTYKIATIPGDGIGVEITDAAIQVLQKLADTTGTFKFAFTNFDWSSKTYKEKGHYIPPDGIDQLKGCFLA